MDLHEVMIEGTLQPDGTLQLDEKPNLSPGRVTVVLRQEAETKPPLKENWFQYLQGIRMKREAEGYPFMNEQEMTAHIEWLREGDRFDDLLDGIEERHGKPEKQ